MSRFSRNADAKVYVGNLGNGAAKAELERVFEHYGPLRNVWVARNPPGFAFVEFEDPRDAEDSVRALDGKLICGSRVCVEMSNGMSRRPRFGRPLVRRPFDPNDRCYQCGERGHYAYDCRSRHRRSTSRSRSHSRGRRYGRSESRGERRRSRSRSGRRSHSRSRSRSHSGSLRRLSRSRSKSFPRQPRLVVSECLVCLSVRRSIGMVCSLVFFVDYDLYYLIHTAHTPSPPLL
uniref:Serine and arginine rich splicing factor 7b n=1 Tax=Eptatretus burgeri TaxID=7764 RepID=A0A8C4NGS1_EPTBU